MVQEGHFLSTGVPVVAASRQRSCQKVACKKNVALDSSSTLYGTLGGQRSLWTQTERHSDQGVLPLYLHNPEPQLVYLCIGSMQDHSQGHWEEQTSGSS